MVTVDEHKATYPLQDESLRRDVHPNIHVVRTSTSEQFGTYQKVTGKKQVPFSGFSGEDAQPSLVQKVARFVRGNFFFPDARKGWNKHAYAAASKLIREGDVKHWITTSPPHSTQLVGRKLKRNFDIHWVADFRDPWTDIYYYKLFYPTALVRRIEASMEKSVFQGCDTLLSVSPSWSALYAQKGEMSMNKVHTLTNGFDAQDFEGITPSRPERFTITYAGTLAGQYPVEHFVAALNRVEAPVTVQIIGSWDKASEEKFANVPNNVAVEWKGYMSKSALNTYLVNSHCMLFLLPNVESSAGHIPGKLFDYLGGGNPILGLGPTKGDAATIIAQADAGKVFDYTDHRGVASFITALQKKAPRTEPSKISQFERSNQAAVLAKLLFS